MIHWPSPRECRVQVLVEELADVLEVVRSLAAELGMSLADIVEVADRKAVERGSFAHGLFLLEVADQEA